MTALDSSKILYSLMSNKISKCLWCLWIINRLRAQVLKGNTYFEEKKEITKELLKEGFVVLVSGRQTLDRSEHVLDSPRSSKFIYYSLNNGYVEGSFIRFLEPVGGPADPKSVAHNLVAPRTCSPPNLVAPRTGSCAGRPKIGGSQSCSPPNL